MNDKIYVECFEMIETEKRGRSIVLAGLDEAPPDLSPNLCLKDLDAKIENVTDAL